MRPTPSTTEGLTSTFTMARAPLAAARRRSLLLVGAARQRRRGAVCREPSWVGSAPAAAPARPAAAADAWRPASRHWGRAVRARSRMVPLLRGAAATPGLGAASSALAAACIVPRPACTPLGEVLMSQDAECAAGPQNTRPEGCARRRVEAARRAAVPLARVFILHTPSAVAQAAP